MPSVKWKSLGVAHFTTCMTAGASCPKRFISRLAWKPRKALTEIVGQIQTLERRLADLKEAL